MDRSAASLIGGAVAASLLAVLIYITGEPMRYGDQLMRTTSLPLRHENVIEASVTIRRTVDDVFSFYRDVKNLPRSYGTACPLSRLVRQRRDGQYRVLMAFERNGR